MLISHQPRANRQGYGNRPDPTRELRERSRKRALELFSANNILPQYETLYRRVIAGVD